MHRKIAADVIQSTAKVSTLEIGAGTLNQLKYEKDATQEYDIVEPFNELFRDSPFLNKIRNVYADITDVPPTQKYDRITTIATFEHIMDLPFVVAKAALLLKENGHLRVAIPNEGTIMWTLGTKVTGFEFRKKYGLDYQTLMKYEHVNTSDDIEKVLEYFFEKTKCSVFGISKGLAFYRFYDCSIPALEKVKKYLVRRS
jgi:SAM-dependent methyltransferase